MGSGLTGGSRYSGVPQEILLMNGTLPIACPDNSASAWCDVLNAVRSHF